MERIPGEGEIEPSLRHENFQKLVSFKRSYPQKKSGL